MVHWNIITSHWKCEIFFTNTVGKWYRVMNYKGYERLKGDKKYWLRLDALDTHQTFFMSKASQSFYPCNFALFCTNHVAIQLWMRFRKDDDTTKFVLELWHHFRFEQDFSVIEFCEQPLHGKFNLLLSTLFPNESFSGVTGYSTCKERRWTKSWIATTLTVYACV